MNDVAQKNHDLQMYDAQLKNKDKIILEYDTEMKNLHHQFEELNNTLHQNVLKTQISANEQLQKRIHEI